MYIGKRDPTVIRSTNIIRNTAHYSIKEYRFGRWTVSDIDLLQYSSTKYYFEKINLFPKKSKKTKIKNKLKNYLGIYNEMIEN